MNFDVIFDRFLKSSVEHYFSMSFDNFGVKMVNFKVARRCKNAYFIRILSKSIPKYFYLENLIFVHCVDVEQIYSFGQTKVCFTM